MGTFSEPVAYTAQAEADIICYINTLHTDPAHHVLSRRDGCTHGQLRPSHMSCLEYILKVSHWHLVYIASLHHWSHWWTERKHSHRLHRNFLPSLLSCSGPHCCCHCKGRSMSGLCPCSTWSCHCSRGRSFLIDAHGSTLNSLIIQTFSYLQEHSKKPRVVLTELG